MATMRIRRYRIEPSLVGLWLAGVLFGALLVVGVNQLRQVSHPAAPVSQAPMSSTAADAAMQQGSTAPAAVQPSEPSVAGGRLGGIESADTANDALVRESLRAQSGDGGAHDLPRVDEETYYRSVRAGGPPPYDFHREKPQ